MTQVKKIELEPLMTDQEVAKLSGKHLGEKDYKTLITYDADVYCKETGKCIAKFRKGLISEPIQKLAYENLKGAAKETDNRGISGGSIDGKTRKFRELSDGTISKTSEAQNSVKSGIIGYFDATPRYPYCRQTAFNQHQFKKFKNAYPIIKTVDNVYKELMPKQYELQRKQADSTPSEYVIPYTAFTTVTVNMSWQTAVHQDKGDFKGGFGNLVALRAGEFKGGYFVVPKWGPAFDLQNGDVLLVDVHQWHGNTPIVNVTPRAKRLSLVMYYREKMIKCDPASDEIKKAKEKTKTMLKKAHEEV